MTDLQISVKTPAGKAAGTVEVDAETFGIEPNTAVMHQVVTAQLAARRSGTHSTKTRAEVRGGGAKPWKQKGTGRARAGSTRSPIWVGGGIAHGPRPRDYSQRTPKKMVKLALRSALSDRQAEGKVVVVDSWAFDKPSTKAAKAALDALEIDGKALIVIERDEANAAMSFRNLPNAFVLASDQLNTHDVLASDYVIFTRSSLPGAPTEAGEPTAAEADAAEDGPAEDAAAEGVTADEAAAEESE